MYMAARRGAAPAPMPAPTYARTGAVPSACPVQRSRNRAALPDPTMTIIRGTDRGDYKVKRMAHTKIMQRLPMHRATARPAGRPGFGLGPVRECEIHAGTVEIPTKQKW
jgi:hypothetical protein